MPERKIDPKFNIHSSYRTVNILNPYRYSGGGISYEAETEAYMTAVGIADDAGTLYYAGTPQEITGHGIWVAVDNYVKALKADSILSKLKAVYPLIGGTADRHKWNLINPQNTDAAFRMVWYGSGVHSATGFKGNGTDAYGDTRFNQSVHSALNSESYGIFTTTTTSDYRRDMGLSGNNSEGVYIENRMIALYNDSTYGSIQGGNKSTSFISGSNFFTANRLSSTQISIQQNNSYSLISDTSISPILNLNFFVGGNNNGGSLQFPSLREFQYAFIGEGLTETEMSAHYNAVQQLQTDLKRAV